MQQACVAVITCGISILYQSHDIALANILYTPLTYGVLPIFHLFQPLSDPVSISFSFLATKTLSRSATPPPPTEPSCGVEYSFFLLLLPLVSSKGVSWTDGGYRFLSFTSTLEVVGGIIPQAIRRHFIYTYRG